MKNEKYHCEMVMLIEQNEKATYSDASKVRMSQFARDVHIHSDVRGALQCLKACAEKKSCRTIPEYIFLGFAPTKIEGSQFLTRFEQLSKRFPTTQVVILTDEPHTFDQQKAKRFDSVVAYFSRPLDELHLRYLRGKSFEKKRSYFVATSY